MWNTSKPGKQAQKKRRTVAELKADRQAAEADRFKLYSAVPQKDYVRLSGRQRKILVDQAGRLGIPCRGMTIDIGAVLHWVHDHIAKESRRPKVAKAVDSEALERVRRATAEKLETENKIQAGELIPIVTVTTAFSALAARLVGAVKNIENAIATEVDVWLSSAEFKALPSDARARKVQAWVAGLCDDVRRAEADGVGAVLKAAEEQLA